MKGFKTKGWICIALAGMLSACGDRDKETVKAPRPNLMPASICSLDEGLSSSGYATLDHDGGSSDLRLQWSATRQTFFICGDEYTFQLKVKNVSTHSEANRVWFTIIHYYGNEYMTDWGISPQGITIPAGAEQTFDYRIQVDERFSSAEGREITVAIIIQTDNPNYSDPDAFFTRTWIRFLPASDCAAEPMEQPPAQSLAVHSVTCQDNTVVLQTHTSLMQGFPHSEVVKGGMSLNGGVYQKGDFLYQSTHVDDKIPAGEHFRVDMLSNESDRLRFYFRERVDCAWLPKNPPKPIAEPPVDPELPELPEEPMPEPQPQQTHWTRYADLMSCGYSLPGAETPPFAGAVLGQAEVEHKPDGKTFFRTTVTNLPTRADLAAQPWLDDTEGARYVVWLTRQLGERLHVIPIAVLTPPENGEAVLARVPVNLSGVASIHADAGMLIDAAGNAEPYTKHAALDRFEGVVVTLQPSGNLETPSGIVMAGGAK